MSSKGSDRSSYKLIHLYDGLEKNETDHHSFWEEFEEGILWTLLQARYIYSLTIFHVYIRNFE
jgi:hypothetical protein